MVTVTFCNPIFAKEQSSGLKTNISGWKGVSGSWELANEGYEGKNKNAGDAFLLSDINVDGSTSFVYECDTEVIDNVDNVSTGDNDVVVLFALAAVVSTFIAITYKRRCKGEFKSR